MPIRVQIEVSGPAELLRPFRTRANALLDEQFEDRYAEHHTGDKLEYRLIARQGIPFPPFVVASEECPELVVSVSWQDHDGPQRGAARISAGKVIDYTDDAPTGAGDAMRVHIEAAADGAIGLAVALRPRAPSEWIGYVVDAHGQAYFRAALDDAGVDLRLTEDVATSWAKRYPSGCAANAPALACHEPIEAGLLQALDDLSRAFVDEWIWFDAEPEIDTALERHRFTLYGLRTYPANLRSGRMRRTMSQFDEGYRYSTLDDTGDRVVAALTQRWKDGDA